MPNTANGFPYPAATDTPDVPRDVKALADAVDAEHVRVNAGFQPLINPTLILRGAGGSPTWTFQVDGNGDLLLARDGVGIFRFGFAGNSRTLGTITQNANPV